MNARKVNQSTVDQFSEHVDVDDIYITHTIEQSDQCLDEIIKKKYPLILCGGGDGTVMRIMEQIRYKIEKLNRAGSKYRMPKFCILKLGTGNAWAGLLDVPKGVKPIMTMRQFPPKDFTYEVFNMIEADNRLFHIGGFGVDALILNDYIDFKKKYTQGLMWKITNTLFGYLIAIIFKSLPKLIFKGFKLNVRIINESNSTVYKAGYSQGVVKTSLKKGDIIYEGPVDAVIFGATSDYGFKLKVMPYAMAKQGYLNLRFMNTGVLKILQNVKSLWLGKWEHPNLHDYLIEEVKIEIDEDSPFQLGGDPEGYRKELHLKVSDFIPQVLDFKRLPK